MDISDFELFALYGVCVGILWLTFRSDPETPFLSILHHSNTPAILDGSLPAEPNSSAAALNTKIINYQSPNSGHLRSFSGLALLPVRARRSVWTRQAMILGTSPQLECWDSGVLDYWELG
jgi:hypothetical protein